MNFRQRGLRVAHRVHISETTTLCLGGGAEEWTVVKLKATEKRTEDNYLTCSSVQSRNLNPFSNGFPGAG